MQAADAGTYTVTVANTAGSRTSDGAVLLVVGGGVAASHALAGPGVIPGTPITITNTMNYSGLAAAAGWQVLVPTGFSLASDTATTAETRPVAGTTGLLEWSWTTVPPSPLTFTYTLNTPTVLPAGAQLAAIAVLRPEGMPAALQLLAQPDPLVLPTLSPHSADTGDGATPPGPPNFRISLSELTRVIELYNTRNGTVRTGCCAVATTTTEDGFAPWH